MRLLTIPLRDKSTPCSALSLSLFLNFFLLRLFFLSFSFSLSPLVAIHFLPRRILPLSSRPFFPGQDFSLFVEREEEEDEKERERERKESLSLFLIPGTVTQHVFSPGTPVTFSPPLSYSLILSLPYSLTLTPFLDSLLLSTEVLEQILTERERRRDF